MTAVGLTVIAPAHNEQDNVGPLVEQIAQALAPLTADWEIVIVDDASTDDTAARLRALRTRHPRLRVLAVPADGRGPYGQSAAFRAGSRAARGAVVAWLDADLQNDPADIPRLLAILREHGADMVQGDRSAQRRDTLVRRISSTVGRLARRAILNDPTRDTGCSLRVMRCEVARALPLEYRGMHRFVPYTVRALGFNVIEVPVSHRPRTAGRAKYGVWNRALPGMIDCFAVRWMRNRRRSPPFEEIT